MANILPISFVSGYGRFESKFLCVEHSDGCMSFINPDCVVGRVYWAAFNAEKKTMKIAYLLEKESRYVEMHGQNAAAMAAHFRALSTVMMTEERRAAFVADLEKVMAESPPTTAEFLAESGIRIAPASPEEAAALAASPQTFQVTTAVDVEPFLSQIDDTLAEFHKYYTSKHSGFSIEVDSVWFGEFRKRMASLKEFRDASQAAASTPSLLGRTPPRVDYRLAVDMLIEVYDAPSEGPGGEKARLEWLQSLGRRINDLRALREMDKP